MASAVQPNSSVRLLTPQSEVSPEKPELFEERPLIANMDLGSNSFTPFSPPISSSAPQPNLTSSASSSAAKTTPISPENYLSASQIYPQLSTSEISGQPEPTSWTAQQPPQSRVTRTEAPVEHSAPPRKAFKFLDVQPLSFDGVKRWVDAIPPMDELAAKTRAAFFRGFGAEAIPEYPETSVERAILTEGMAAARVLGFGMETAGMILYPFIKAASIGDYERYQPLPEGRTDHFHEWIGRVAKKLIPDSLEGAVSWRFGIHGIDPLQTEQFTNDLLGVGFGAVGGSTLRAIRGLRRQGCLTKWRRSAKARFIAATTFCLTSCNRPISSWTRETPWYDPTC